MWGLGLAPRASCLVPRVPEQRVSAVSVGALWPLWLLVLLPLMWWAAMRSRSTLARRHLAVATILRSAALVFVVLALLRPVWTAPATQVSVVYALDVSRSVASGFVQSALQFVQRANAQAKPDAVRYVVFAERARTVARVEDVEQVAVSDAPQADRTRLLYQGATNLERALDQALLGLDPDRVKRVVLFTDGNQTHGDVWRALPRLRAQGVRVFAFPATPQTRSDAWIEALELPDTLRRDEPVAVTVRVYSQQRTPARVRLSAAGQALAGRDIALDPGDNSVVLSVRLRQAGMVTLLAQVQAQGDALHDNDRLEQSVWVGPRPRMLYLEGQPQAARYLRDALAQEGLDVKAAGPADVPASSAALDRFDAVIVSDLSPDVMDSTRMQALQGYVRDPGGGLLFAAGENTYGEPGYTGTPVEKVLPVEFKAQEKRKDLALICASIAPTA